MQQRSEDLIRGLGLRYGAVLAIVAALLIVDQAILQPLLIRLNLYAPVINLAGRQRMLSQRLMKGSLAVVRDPSQATTWKPELENSLADWKRVHAGLQNGDADLHLPETHTPAIRSAFEILEPRFQSLVAGTQTVLDDPLHADAAIASMLEHEGAYLTAMDGIVRMYEIESQGRVQQLRWLGVALTVVALSLMAGLYGLVLKPATKLIRSQVHALTASENRFRTLIERMHDGLVILSAGGRIDYANDRFCRIVRRERSELIGHPLAFFTGGTHRERLLALVQGAARDPGRAEEIAWSALGGAECVTLVAPGLGVDEAGGSLATFLVVTDITVQKEHEVRLKNARDTLEQRVVERTGELTRANASLAHEAQERTRAEERNRELHSQLAHAARITSLGQLATGIAHEINQPLGAITNYSEALCVMTESDALPTSEVQAIAARLREAALRAGRIVSRMRNFVRNRTTARSVERLNPLIEDVLELCDAELRQNDVRVRPLLVETDEESVEVDAIQIQQVLVNLVRNAIQAMETTPLPDRVLTLRTGRSVGGVVIEVQDTGPGFPGDNPEIRFNPFQSTKAEGLGMGLSISQSLIAAHGGELTAENVAPRGARVSLHLPLANASEHLEPADRLRRR